MKRKAFLIVFLFAIGVLYTLNGSENNDLRPSLSAVRIDRPVSLSGKLDDPLWEKAVPVELKYEIMPGENTPARQKTMAMVLYDDHNLYVGFRCYDSLPGSIRAHLSDRDKIFSDDYVIVSIDTYNNFQRGFELATNPYGIQGDLLMMGSGNEDISYDMVWQSAASMNSEGWIAEMAIPFKALSFSSDSIQNWTITLLRSIPRDNRYMVTWTPVDRSNPSWLAQGGTLAGMEGIKPGKAFDFLPYTMIQQSGSRVDIGDPASSIDHGGVKARIGAGITYSPGPNTTINAVINPDFSQIESDADQISVNTTFALYYDEKRPFFMSGMDLLQTPMYYSRTINNPLFAAKINGKIGKISYLALAANDRNTVVTVPGEEQSNTVETNLNSYAGVARVRYDIGDENFIGALLLSRNFTEGHNYLGGIDWNYKFLKNWYWEGEIFLTNTREMNDTLLFKSARSFGSTGHDAGFNGETYSGTGIHLALRKVGRNFSMTFVQNNFSPAYQTYNGMFPEVNVKQSYMNQGYTFHLNKKIFQRIRLSNSVTLIYNYDDVFKELTVQPTLAVSMIGQTSVNLGYLVVNNERFRDVIFRGVNRMLFVFETTPVKGVNLSLSGTAGRYIYRSSDPQLGKGYNLYAELAVEPASWLKSSVSWSAAKLKDTDTGEEFYNGYILRNVTNLQFTKKMFLRGITQYNSFDKSLSFYPLLNYKFNAFTMFCAGMTRDYLDYEQEGYAFRTTGYQYFVKIQYLFSR